VSNFPAIGFEELMSAAKLHGGNDIPSAWTFGTLSVSTPSRLTLFPPSETCLPHEPAPPTP
jgi:hypothetical protein